MPVLPSTALPAFLRTLSSSLPSSLPPSSSLLIPLLTTTTLGHAHPWLSPLLAHSLSALPPTPSPVPPEPANPHDDRSLHPRRYTLLLAKEALTKSAILIGVPRAIEALLELQRLAPPEDRPARFVRKTLDDRAATIRERQDAGERGLRSVYQAELDGIFGLMREEGLDDLRYLSRTVTYGTFLTPLPSSPSSSSPSADPFSPHPHLLPLLTLPCLIPQRTPRELGWHLRGALRLGWRREEVEALQRAVEGVCEACGVDGVGEGMPRVEGVPRQKAEGQERAW
ncbi:hypothetical protein JCM10207_006859 [Rhodosporidiobolus poonsookiae]